MTSEAIRRPVLDLSNHGGEYTPRHDQLQKLVLKRPDMVVLNSNRNCCNYSLDELDSRLYQWPAVIDDWANISDFKAIAEVPLDAPFISFVDIVVTQKFKNEGRGYFDENPIDSEFLILVEIKTKLTSLGSTLRQINSYLKYGAMGKKFSRAILLTENPLDYDDSLFFHQNGIFTVCKEEVN